MSPIRLDPDERAALRMLADTNGICERCQLSRDHAQKFLQLGLLLETVNSYHFTQRGQIEVLRQNFHSLSGSKRAIKIKGSKGTLLNARVFGLPGTDINTKPQERWVEKPSCFEVCMSATQVSMNAFFSWSCDTLIQLNKLPSRNNRAVLIFPVL